MEARCVEAGSMSIFCTQNRALKTTSLARVPIRTWWDPVGPSSSLRWDPNRARWDPVGPSSSLRGTQIGFGGTRWDRWVPALRDPTPRLGFTMLTAGCRGPSLIFRRASTEASNARLA